MFANRFSLVTFVIAGLCLLSACEGRNRNRNRGHHRRHGKDLSNDQAFGYEEKTYKQPTLEDEERTYSQQFEDKGFEGPNRKRFDNKELEDKYFGNGPCKSKIVKCMVAFDEAGLRGGGICVPYKRVNLGQYRVCLPEWTKEEQLNKCREREPRTFAVEETGKNCFTAQDEGLGDDQCKSKIFKCVVTSDETGSRVHQMCVPYHFVHLGPHRVCLPEWKKEERLKKCRERDPHTFAVKETEKNC